MNEQTMTASLSAPAPAPAPAAPPATGSGPAAPAVSPAAPSTPAESRPRTVDDLSALLAQGESATPDPESAPAAAEPTPAQATDAPAPAPAESVPGPIPFDRHKAALDNARQKARDEVIGEVRQHYGGAVQLAEAMRRDPVGTITQLVSELQSHPDYGPQLRSHAARVLAQRGQPAAEPEPEPDLQTADGQLVYSAGQLAKREAWQAKRLQAEITKQITTDLAPVLEMAQERQAQRVERQYIEQAMGGYRPQAEQLMKMPGYDEHRDAVVARQKELFEDSMRRGEFADLMALAWQAYREIVPEKLQAHQQQQQMAAAVAKATGRMDNPAAAVAAPPGRPKSMTDAFKGVGLIG